MPKAKKKTEKESSVVETVKTSDYSAEKRMEMANEKLVGFLEKVNADMGLALDVQLLTTPKGIIPRMVWIDLVAQRKQVAKQQQLPAPKQDGEKSDDGKQE